MKFLSVLVISLCLSTTVINTQSSVEDIETSLTTFQDEAVFTLTNVGDSDVTVDYIVIQDNILMKEQGTTVVPEGDSKDISVEATNAQAHSFTIELTEVE